MGIFALPGCLISLFSTSESEMRINSGKKENENWFSDECDFFCSLADSTLTNMIQRIFSGAISLQEMEGVYQKLPQVEKLCIASSRHNWEYNWDDVKTAMINRYRECVAFKRYKEILTTFCLDLETQKLNIEGKSLICLGGLFVFTWIDSGNVGTYGRSCL